MPPLFKEMMDKNAKSAVDKYCGDERLKYSGGEKKPGAATHKEYSRARRMLRLIESERTRSFVDKIQESAGKSEGLIEFESWRGLSQAEHKVQLQDSIIKQFKLHFKLPKDGRSRTRPGTRTWLQRSRRSRRLQQRQTKTVKKEGTSLVNMPGQLLE